ncbi:acetoacetate--CoA ligase [Endozoicomonas sp. SCSIO W0465]|uniref:acetoacetate--CoA ligase n=1 Tax=Endozoicomonas sp. SCSIO W0465 TaxID=2918516 RepID=UPI002076654B|nr:acetoacetate--CoA ligase [Endozoicomonas sp. SCSIO W0465]USE34618.1 acetoacetate--CoA ligase [Endozoicomonas sp. SCSIO W0465]
MTALWIPDQTTITSSNLQAFINRVKDVTGLPLENYSDLYQWSIDDRPGFWQLLAEFYQIQFHTPPSAALINDSMPGAQWFPGATLNYAEHLLQRKDRKSALIFNGENGCRRTLSYKELYHSVAAAQKGLIEAGIKKGDRVAAFMPNCPETIILMLATTALGAIWSSCSPDFGIQGVLDRFGQIEPRLLLAVDRYFYGGKTINCLAKIGQIQQKIPSLETTVIVPFANPEPDIGLLNNAKLWADFCEPSNEPVSIVPVEFNHPLFIMYSSGTTGVPKCIVHGHGGTLLQHLKELGLHTDLKEQDTIFFFTTCGWMMWNWLVSSLALGATVVLFDGSPFYPQPATLMDMAEAENVAIFGTSAKYIAALQKAGVKPASSHNLQHLKTILSTGSPLLHESYDYVFQNVKPDVRLSSISGGTDIISCFALGCPILPVYRGELQCRGLGMDVHFVDTTGTPLIEEKGELVCRSSFPSMPVGFWNDPDGTKYHNAYFNEFAGLWAHGDYGELTGHDGIIIHGRADAVLNPGGVRIGTAEIYRQVEKVEEVLDSIAVGQDWEDDIRIILFVQLRDGVSLDDELVKKITQTIRSNTTPRHVPAKVLQVTDIPRTISGKIVELAVREVIHDRPVKNTDALANPDALDLFRNRQELFS